MRQATDVFSRRSEERGVSLLEILLAMLVLGLVTAGIFNAFVFSRKVNWRSQTQVMVQSHAQRLLEGLRLAVAGEIPAGNPLAGLTLEPGYYVDAKMPSRPSSATVLYAPGSTTSGPLDFPAELQRFQTTSGNGVHLFIERANEATAATDYDGDGLKGLDFNSDSKTDLKRVRVRIQWTIPTA